MLNNLYGYDFFFASQGRNILVEFPITPAELNIKMGSNNETVNLINDGDVNILKSLQLTEIEFEATFPMKKYSYSRDVRPFKEYFDIFKDFLVSKKWFRFIVVRNPLGTGMTAPTSSNNQSVEVAEDVFANDPSISWDIDEFASNPSIAWDTSDHGPDSVPPSKYAPTRAEVYGLGPMPPGTKPNTLAEAVLGSKASNGSINDTIKGKRSGSVSTVSGSVSGKTAWSSSTTPNRKRTSSRAAQEDHPGYWYVREGDSIVVDGYYGFWNTNIPVSLESMEIKENADDGDDVVIEFKLKQYKAYGVKYLQTKAASTSTATEERAETKETDKDKEYTIVAGDTLTIISKKFYGSEEHWKKIYEKNKDIIEKTARDMGKESSMGGNYIWAGVKITIPALT